MSKVTQPACATLCEEDFRLQTRNRVLAIDLTGAKNQGQTGGKKRAAKLSHPLSSEGRQKCLPTFLQSDIEITLEFRQGNKMTSIWHDLRYGLRMLGKNPGVTILAILTLALGIGAATLIGSVVDTVMLNPFPYKNADRLATPSISNGITRFPVPVLLDSRNKTIRSKILVRSPT